jgi:hypothetical protein
LGIKNIKKLYILSHIRKFDKKKECKYSHKSNKLIGIFLHRSKAQNTISSYRKLEGFKEYPNEFFIQEYLINEINEEALEELKSKLPSTK